MEETIRRPAVAGQFYTGDPNELRSEIEEYIDASGLTGIEGEILSIISPHAGYMYSGRTAAYAYSILREAEFRNVVVISPSHTEYFEFSSVFGGKSYMTPLGEIPVNRELVDLITSKSELVRISSKGHSVSPGGRSEHALEVQLPFLQVVLDDFKLVPIVMGDQSRRSVEALGSVLGESLNGQDALIVASTDLSHFHDDGTARALDGVFIDNLEDFDPEGLLQSLARKKTEACGGGPAAAAMIASRIQGANRCKVLNYSNSGDVTGDTRNVVGYVSAVVFKEKKSDPSRSLDREKGGENEPGDGTVAGSDLSRDDKLFLINLAKNVIEAEFDKKSVEIDVPDREIMKQRRGAFVTLKKKGQLRGCIGYIEAVKPLVDTIREMASAAAFRDPRFRPVSAEELPQLEYEISVLSPITEISDPSIIEVGRHGIIITRGMNRGLLLPQVAAEWGWDRETFLAQTCVKAGLPENAWRQSGTKIEIFSADVFSEKELGIR